MKTPREILNFIGHEQAATALGVARLRVERAARQDRLPALWYHTLERLAGRPLPRECFHWKGVA